MSTLLALDSASRTLSLALYDGQSMLAELTWATANNHSVELAPAIADLLRLGGLTMGGLNAVAVSLGPGSFNGLRIGVSAAKGIALARNLPLIGVRTLDVVAAAQFPLPNARLIAAVAAGRGRVAACTYHVEGGVWHSDDNTHIADWPGVIQALPPHNGPIWAAGEIDSGGRAALEAAHIRVVGAVGSLRRAGYLAEIAWGVWQAGGTFVPDSVQPFYLHQPGVPHP